MKQRKMQLTTRMTMTSYQASCPPHPTTRTDDAYAALRKQQRRLKTIRAIRHLSSLLNQPTASSPLTRLLNVFVKLFRSLYSHALEVECDDGGSR